MEFFKHLIEQAASIAATAGIRLIGAALIIFIGFRLTNRLTDRLRSRGLQRIDASNKTFLDSLITYSLKTIILVVAIAVLGVPMASVVAVLGSVGLALGLAMQGGLANIAGGVMLILFRPFGVGDYIKTGEYEGYVTAITIPYTTLRTYDNRLITIPNGSISSATVDNWTRNKYRRTELEFSVAYESDPDAVRAALLEAAAECPLVLDGSDGSCPAPRVVMTAHADSALIFRLQAWCASEDYWDVCFALFEGVKRTFDRKGIEIPFPQLDVHLRGGQDGK